MYDISSLATCTFLTMGNSCSGNGLKKHNWNKDDFEINLTDGDHESISMD